MLTGPLQCEWCKVFYRIDNNRKCNVVQCLGHLQMHHESDYVPEQKCTEITVKKCNEVTEMNLYDRAVHCLRFHVTDTTQLYSVLMCQMIDTKAQPGLLEPEDEDNCNAIMQFAQYCKQKYVAPDAYIAPTTIIKEAERKQVTINDNLHERHYCRNENPEVPLMFYTPEELQQHISVQHKCSYCDFATMYDSDLRKHIAIHERKIICAICNKQVLNMQHHLNSAHKQCVACLNYFIDRQQLQVHEPKCKIVQANTFNDSIKGKANKENSLEIDSKNIESSFSNLLISMLESSSLPQAEVMQGKKVISSFAAESKIAKNRVRLENVSLRRNDALLFDVPDFQHSSKSNLPKVLAAVGTVQEHEKFDATSEQAKRNAINNFEN